MKDADRETDPLILVGKVREDSPNIYLKSTSIKALSINAVNTTLWKHRVPTAGHLDEFAEARPRGRVLPNFETQENDVLMKCVPSFRELRRAAGDSSTSK